MLNKNSAIFWNLPAEGKSKKPSLSRGYLPPKYPRRGTRRSGGQSKICLGLYVCEGQHKAQKTRIYSGAIRKLCANPMIFVKNPSLSLFVRDADNGILTEEMPELLVRLPDIRYGMQKRINWLQRLRIKEWHIDEISRRLCPDLGQILLNQIKVDRLTQWQLYNLVTHHISHEVEQTKHIPMLLEASNIFEL